MSRALEVQDADDTLPLALPGVDEARDDLGDLFAIDLMQTLQPAAAASFGVHAVNDAEQVGGRPVGVPQPQLAVH